MVQDSRQIGLKGRCWEYLGMGFKAPCLEKSQVKTGSLVKLTVFTAGCGLTWANISMPEQLMGWTTWRASHVRGKQTWGNNSIPNHSWVVNQRFRLLNTQSYALGSVGKIIRLMLVKVYDNRMFPFYEVGEAMWQKWVPMPNIRRHNLQIPSTNRRTYKSDEQGR